MLHTKRALSSRLRRSYLTASEEIVTEWSRALADAEERFLPSWVMDTVLEKTDAYGAPLPPEEEMREAVQPWLEAVLPHVPNFEGPIWEGWWRRFVQAIESEVWPVDVSLGCPAIPEAEGAAHAIATINQLPLAPWGWVRRWVASAVLVLASSVLAAETRTR